MGILDDAIREHLELKRQHGAAQSDIERLESEAFGPAARPGDPGYETGESPLPSPGAGEVAAGDEAPTTVAPAAGSEQGEPRPGEGPGGADAGELEEGPEASLEPQAPEVPQAPESPAEPVEAPEAGIFDADDEGELDVGAMNTEDFAAAAAGERLEPSPAERARIEHADLDDTIDHPAPQPASLSEELEQAAPVPPPEEDDEDEAPAPIEPRPAAEEEAAPEGEDDGDEDDESDADLLEETPEFLKDAPEGEDLWFEQGPPKDFDFDD